MSDSTVNVRIAIKTNCFRIFFERLVPSNTILTISHSMTFVFVCWHTQQIKIQMQISWVGQVGYPYHQPFCDTHHLPPGWCAGHSTPVLWCFFLLCHLFANCEKKKNIMICNNKTIWQIPYPTQQSFINYLFAANTVVMLATKGRGKEMQRLSETKWAFLEHDARHHISQRRRTILYCTIYRSHMVYGHTVIPYHTIVIWYSVIWSYHTTKLDFIIPYNCHGSCVVYNTWSVWMYFWE